MCASSFTVVRVCTGYVLPARVCADSFHSTCVYWLCPPTARVCAGSFHSTCVYWLCCPTARVCAGSFTVRVCTGHYLPYHVCALVVLQYMGVLVMVFCEYMLTWLTAA